MNIKPIPAPTAPQATQPQAPRVQQTAQTTQASAARDRAIAMLSGQAPDVNQNNVSTEELSAIPQDRQEDSLEATLTPEQPEVKVEEKEDPVLSKQFAQLAKQEKALRAQMQQMKAKEAELKAKELEMTQKATVPQMDPSQYISKDQLKQDALSVLAEAGITYEELTNQLLNQPQRDPRMEAHISKLEAKIKALEEGVETTKQSYTQQQQQAYQAAIKQIESDVKSLITKDPSFEAIKAANATKDVVELIEKTYNEDGILLSVEEAAQQVEDFLIEEYTKLTSLQKIQKRMAESNASKQPSPSVKTAEATTTKQPQQMKTLTNTTSSNRQLSAKERAILAFKGELK